MEVGVGAAGLVGGGGGGGEGAIIKRVSRHRDAHTLSTGGIYERKMVVSCMNLYRSFIEGIPKHA